MSFLQETSVADALRAAAIPDLVVKESPDMDQAKFKALDRPTAIVVLGDEERQDSSGSAVLIKCYLSVYLVLRGAFAARQNRDRELRDAIFSALHDQDLAGLSSPLAWESTVADYEGNARTYLMTFSCTYAKRP